jgi:hypothetical protein
VLKDLSWVTPEKLVIFEEALTVYLWHNKFGRDSEEFANILKLRERNKRDAMSVVDRNSRISKPCTRVTYGQVTKCGTTVITMAIHHAGRAR